MVIVWRLRGNIIRTVLYIANVLPLQWAQLTKTVHTARLGLEFVFLCFLGCMICLYVGVCFVLPWTVESLSFMLWRWRNKLKWAPFELFALSSSLQVRSWLHPFKGHCEQKAMRDEGVIYVAGYPLPNRRCTRLPGCLYFLKCKLQLLKARYSLIVLKVPLNSNQSISWFRQWNKFENRPIFDEVKAYKKCAASFWVTLYNDEAFIRFFLPPQLTYGLYKRVKTWKFVQLLCGEFSDR